MDGPKRVKMDVSKSRRLSHSGRSFDYKWTVGSNESVKVNGPKILKRESGQFLKWTFKRKWTVIGKWTVCFQVDGLELNLTVIRLNADGPKESKGKSGQSKASKWTVHKC